MIYILIGLVMSSLMVGSIVTAITTVNDSAEVKIYGRKVCTCSCHFLLYTESNPLSFFLRNLGPSRSDMINRMIDFLCVQIPLSLNKSCYT